MRHDEIRHVAFTPAQMFHLVADVERYPEFLPWCVGARVRNRTPTGYLADLIIGFKMLRERYTSKVTLDHDGMTLAVEYLDGPFRHLENLWRFRPAEDGGCDVEFHIDFEFRSKVLQNLIGRMFGEAVRVMVNAFEKRAGALYAPGPIAHR